MEINALIERAKELANKVKEINPNLASQENSALCVIVTKDEEIFGGVNCICVNSGEVMEVSAEVHGVMQMLAAGEVVAQKIVKLLLKDGSFGEVSQESLDMLLRADPDNEKCEIVLNEEKVDTIGSIKHLKDGSDEFMSGFGEEDSEDELEEESEEFNEDSNSEENLEDSEQTQQEDSPQEEQEEQEETEEGSDDSDEESSDTQPVSEQEEEQEEVQQQQVSQAEFVNSVEIDESNPFYEPPVQKEESQDNQNAQQLEYLYEQPSSEESSKGKDSKADSKANEKMDAKAKKELLKQAKKKKKFAKLNSSFKKKG